ncbi:MAG TPA: carbohydrate kinase family protein [Vicinamibacterales bacterium]
MLDVIGVGTNSVDEVLQLPGETGVVLAGGKVRVSDRRFMCGGQTATVVAACAALGLRSGYLGAFGSDEHGRRIRNDLESLGVDVRGSVECDTPNRGAVILVDPLGNRTVLWHRSDGLKMPFQGLPVSALQGRVVHVDDDDPELALHAATVARSVGTPVTSDLEHVSEGVEQLIASVTFPIFEQKLPARITGEHDPERALRKLRRLNDGLLVMTRGDEGSVALDGDTFHVTPAFSVKVVDATGAGDAFRAGFIYGLLQHSNVPDRLRFANAAGALSCTKLGAIPSVPTLSEVQKLLASTP